MGRGGLGVRRPSYRRRTAPVAAYKKEGGKGRPLHARVRHVKQSSRRAPNLWVGEMSPRVE
eukprot:7736562-Alexandrium_andersonii.AAC.1